MNRLLKLIERFGPGIINAAFHTAGSIIFYHLVGAVYTIIIYILASMIENIRVNYLEGEIKVFEKNPYDSLDEFIINIKNNVEDVNSIEDTEFNINIGTKSTSLYEALDNIKNNKDNINAEIIIEIKKK